MTTPVILSGDKADWLGKPELQHLLHVLAAGGEEARIAGGAVRNTLLGEDVSDIDIATTTLPEESMVRARAAGFRAVATGIDHGTVTIIAKGTPYEVTTLRSDIETHGRSATVRFGRSWQDDAERRDFTINALYADANGHVIDLVGGLDDLEKRNLRFIGEAEERIREDYLRILRFFRFFAWYGQGRPDAEGLKACSRLKDGLDQLSAERIWAELKKLLAAPDPSRSLLWMRQTGVLTRVLPESEKWGIDGIPGLIATEGHAGVDVDPLRRMQCILPPDSARMEKLADRLKFSKAERERLRDWAFAETPVEDASRQQLARQLYEGPEQGVRDRIALALAQVSGLGTEDMTRMTRHAARQAQWQFASQWVRPVFPLKGQDLISVGFSSGPDMGNAIRRLEEEWVASGFKLEKEALEMRAKDMLAPRPEG